MSLSLLQQLYVAWFFVRNNMQSFLWFVPTCIDYHAEQWKWGHGTKQDQLNIIDFTFVESSSSSRMVNFHYV